MFKYLYHGDNIDLLTSGYVQDENGEVIEIAHTDFKNYE